VAVSTRHAEQRDDPFTVGIETFEAGDDAIDARFAHMPLRHNDQALLAAR
jgi:hypothetical protein